MEGQFALPQISSCPYHHLPNVLDGWLVFAYTDDQLILYEQLGKSVHMP